MAELAVSGPLGEGNLADKLRPDPVHAPLGRVGEEPGQSGFRPGDLLAGLVRHPDPEPCRELGSAWTRRFRPVSADRIWLEVALYPLRRPNASWIRLISAVWPASSKRTRRQVPSLIPYSRVSRASCLRCCADGFA